MQLGQKIKKNLGKRIINLAHGHDLSIGVKRKFEKEQKSSHAGVSS